MIGNALLATSVIFLALGFWLLQECQFLLPYRRLLWVKYGGTMALFAGVLFVNLFTVIYTLCPSSSSRTPGGSWPTWKSRCAAVSVSRRNSAGG
jgi:hypothetical protein